MGKGSHHMTSSPCFSTIAQQHWCLQNACSDTSEQRKEAAKYKYFMNVSRFTLKKINKMTPYFSRQFDVRVEK